MKNRATERQNKSHSNFHKYSRTDWLPCSLICIVYLGIDINRMKLLRWETNSRVDFVRISMISHFLSVYRFCIFSSLAAFKSYRLANRLSLSPSKRNYRTQRRSLIDFESQKSGFNEFYDGKSNCLFSSYN